jgi:AbrB family looped-hinge helix DNA binding protein
MPKTHEHTATVSSKGQVVIPGQVRALLGITQGSRLRFVVDDQGVRLLSAAGDVTRLKARLAAPAKPVSVDDMNAAVAQRRQIVGRGRPTP